MEKRQKLHKQILHMLIIAYELFFHLSLDSRTVPTHFFTTVISSVANCCQKMTDFIVKIILVVMDGCTQERLLLSQFGSEHSMEQQWRDCNLVGPVSYW